MFQRLRNKIAHLQQQPEEVRFRAALKYTIIGGVVIFILWLGVFLPFQLHKFL